MPEIDLGLKGKVALVTGGGGDLGGTCCATFARAGCKIVVADLDPQRAGRTVERVSETGGEAVAAIADLTEATDVERAIATALERFGRLDVCVNNLGGSEGAHGGRAAFVDSDPQWWQEVWERNLLSTFLCSRAAARAMIELGSPGAIVNVTSMSALRSSEGNSPYGAAKAGIGALAITLATELAQHRIRVNCVAPTAINTEKLRTMPPEWLKRTADGIPLGRVAEPEDVANVALFLASDLAAFVTGHTVMCDGGVSCTTMRPGLL